MPLNKSKAKGVIGLRVSWFFPILTEPATGRPTYGAKIDMGAAVKGYISVTTVSGSVPGDDIEQISIDKFASGQLDAETTMNDLEVNARIFGHTYSAENGEISRGDDSPVPGGYAFIEPIYTKEKTTVYRATALLKVEAMPGSEKTEADTKRNGEFNFKNYPVSYKIKECNSGEWRIRQEFESQAAAEEWLNSIFAAAA